MFKEALNDLRNNPSNTSATTEGKITLNMDSLVSGIAPTISTGASVRVLAVGAAISIHRSTDGLSAADEQSNAADWERMRRERGNSSFDIWIDTPDLQLTNSGDEEPVIARSTTICLTMGRCRQARERHYQHGKSANPTQYSRLVYIGS